jgi:two-component system response regulator ChvI
MRDSEGAALPVKSSTEKIRILSVDDDPLYQETLLDLLTDRGFAVRGFADAATFLKALDAGAEAEVLLLDWNLPEVSGIDLLARLRKRGIDTPVAFLTGVPLVDHEAVAFVEGAVDFIDKSRGFEVLASRITRIVTTQWKPNHPAQTTPPMVIGHLTLRPGQVLWRGQNVGLTFSEYTVIKLLASNAGDMCGYRAIYDEMHYSGFVAGKGEDGYQANVRSHIKRIRKKFQAIDPEFDEVVNQVGLGYRWPRQ